ALDLGAEPRVPLQQVADAGERRVRLVQDHLRPPAASGGRRSGGPAPASALAVPPPPQRAPWSALVSSDRRPRRSCGVAFQARHPASCGRSFCSSPLKTRNLSTSSLVNGHRGNASSSCPNSAQRRRIRSASRSLSSTLTPLASPQLPALL